MYIIYSQRIVWVSHMSTHYDLSPCCKDVLPISAYEIYQCQPKRLLVIIIIMVQRMHSVSRVGDIVGKMWMDYMKKYLMWFLPCDCM